MTDSRRDDERIAHVLGEPAADRRSIDPDDPATAAALREIADTLELADQLQVPEPDAAFETRLLARLEAKMEAPSQRTGFRWLAGLLAPRRLVVAGGLAAALLIAFLAGDRWGPGQAAPDGEVRERILVVALGDHLERSRRLLVEIVNQPTGAAATLPAGRDRAAELATANRLLRASLEPTEASTALSELLEDLEAVLVEVANGPNQPSVSEWARVKRRIEKRGLLLRIYVLGDEPSLSTERPSALDRT